MTSVNEPIHRLLSIFATKPCWMIDTLAIELNYSIPSTRRFLSEIGYYRSITHNGKWYTLGKVPKFNKDGLWFKDDIGFSRFSSLTRTLIHLVAQSKTGMTAEKLGEKVRSRCHSVLVRLCRDGKLEREKQGSSFVYLSVDSVTAKAQRQAMQSKPSAQIPSEIALLIFSECIRNPHFGFKQIADAVSRRSNVSVEAAQIECLFEQYGLKKTARTMEQKSCGP